MTRQRGFTLLELMIVVVVIAILAALAMSSYKYAVRKSRRAEAYNTVGQLQLSLERWRAENPCYGKSGGSGCPSTFTASTTYPGDTLPTSSYYTIALPAANATPTSYSVTATPKGAQIGDTCGVLTATGNAKPTWATSSCN
ncbi:MAG: type IV pilin protein [Lysobacteraceae bacterium]